MDGLILAAGRGTRLGVLTADKPKCFTEVGGKRLIDWQVEAMRAAGFNRITVVGGYRSELLEGIGDNLVVNWEWESCQMVQSLLVGLGQLDDEDVIVSYSDIIFSDSVIQQLKAANDPLTIACDRCWEKQWSDRFVNPLSDAETLKIADNRIIEEIGLKPVSLDQIDSQFMGLFKLSSQSIQWIKQVTQSMSHEYVNQMQTTHLFQALIERGYPIYALELWGGWFEIDKPEDLLIVKSWIASGQLRLGR